MSFDLNDAEQQSSGRKYGPLPLGSKVLLKMEFKEVAKPHPKHKYVFVTSGGLNMAWIEFTVISGEYEGVHWRENWMLPAPMQNATMTEGQTKACAISYSKMKAIVDAHRNIDPTDMSAQARAKRTLGSLMDMNGMTFPASLGLDKGREGTDKNGNKRIYFNNLVGTIVTPDRKDYRMLMGGGEIITDGITKRDSVPAPSQPSSYPSSPADNPFGAPLQENLMPSEAPQMDDCPF